MTINLNQVSCLKESPPGEAEGARSDAAGGTLGGALCALPPCEDLPIGKTSGAHGRQKLLNQMMESHREDTSSSFLYRLISDLQNLSENLTQLERGPPEGSVLLDHPGKISLLDLDGSERGRRSQKPMRCQCLRMAQ